MTSLAGRIALLPHDKVAEAMQPKRESLDITLR